ncbi:BnaC02g19480D [Brassica napus]|uniref:BnaC02g19480D protein n=1 Tax=Brassica napus TaxID=3708 RepID=A0A078GTT9_BRANA|nr:BnaC02g19480D [Brassica napus]
MEKHGTDAFERMIVRKDSYERGRRGGGSNDYMTFDDDYMY